MRRAQFRAQFGRTSARKLSHSPPTHHVSRPKDVPEGGGVLIFLPGVAEIQECLKALKRAGLANRAAGLTLLPLHSLQDAAEQQAAMARPPPGTRKVILATNIAESSITARRPAAAAAAPPPPPRHAAPRAPPSPSDDATPRYHLHRTSHVRER